MKAGDIIRRSGRSLRAANLRTLLTALALAVGGFTLTATLAASQGARDYTDRLVASNFDPGSLVVAKDDALFSFGGEQANKPQEYDPSVSSLGGQGNFRVKRLTQADLERLRDLTGVRSVEPDYQFAAQYVTREGAKRYTANIGGYATAPKPEVVAGEVPRELSDGKLLLPEDYIGLLGFDSAQAAVGQRLDLQVQQLTGQTRTDQYEVAAVVRPPSTNANFEPARILLSTGDAGSLYDFINAGTTSEGQFLNAYARVDGGNDEDRLQSTKGEIEKAGYAARTAAEAQEFLNQIINVLQIIVLVFGAITLVASFFGVVNTQYISVLERTREIGLMKALGMRRATVSWLFIVEATWIGFLGAILGAVGAVIAGTLLNPWISRVIGFGDERLLVFEPLQIGALVLFLMVVTTVAGLLPARKAARLDPIEALRSE